MAEDEYFWGRYRDWGNVSAQHVCSLALVFLLLIAVYILISSKISHRRKQICKSLMRGRLRIPDSTKGDKKHGSIFQKYLLHQTSLMNALKPKDAGMGDPGYGSKNNNNNMNTHYNTSIAKSYFALEEAVRSTRPHLRHRHYRTIREFVEAVAIEFPKLKSHLYKYIDLYELARFADYKCTKLEFEEFFFLLGQIVGTLQDSNYFQ